MGYTLFVRLRKRRGFWALAGILSVLVAVILPGAARAEASASDCGTATPAGTGWTPVSDYGTLHADIDGGTNGGKFYLLAPMTDTGYTAGLEVYENASVTIDLDGCSLTIAHPGAGQSGINVSAHEQLTITDSSAAQDGTLNVTGGAGDGSVTARLESAARAPPRTPVRQSV
jgi:hypothetical protein